MLVNNFLEQAVAAENPKAVDHFALLHRIVVHETNRRTAQVAIVDQLPQQQFAGVAGSVDQNPAAGTAVRDGKNLPE